MKVKYSETIQLACDLISIGEIEKASQTIASEYPFSPIQKSGRNNSHRVMTKIFVPDGFVDRYRGTRLIYPPVLRILSHYLGKVFPYHKNGKMVLQRSMRAIRRGNGRR